MILFKQITKKTIHHIGVESFDVHQTFITDKSGNKAPALTIFLGCSDGKERTISFTDKVEINSLVGQIIVHSKQIVK